MTTISKIEIKNLYGKGHFVWELNPVVNILGGKNGSGKTSIFRSCYLMLHEDLITQEEFKAMRTCAENLSITLSNGMILSFDGSIITCYSESGESVSYQDFKAEISAYFINSFEQHVSKAESYSKFLRFSDDADPTILDILIKDQIDLRNKDFSAVMEKYVDDTEEDICQRSLYLKQYKKIYTSLSHFLTDYEGEINSSFNFKRQGNTFGYEYLSMGEKQILLLLLMISNTHNDSCVFFMDEPDLSMHIDWKEILIKELHSLNPNMQIILSTHAPSVITGWMDCTSEVDQLIVK